MRQNTSIDCARSQKRSTNCKRRFRSRSILDWRIIFSVAATTRRWNSWKSCSGVTQTILSIRVTRNRRSIWEEFFTTDFPGAETCRGNSGSSPPQDGFAVVNLTRRSGFPVRQPDGLVLWRACSFCDQARCRFSGVRAFARVLARTQLRQHIALPHIAGPFRA